MIEVAGLEVFKLLIKDLTSSVKSRVSLTRKLKKLDVKNAYLKAHNVEKVKTIWQVDKEVNLHEFYYPTKISVDRKPTPVDSLDTFPENGKVVIQGTAGQGKSILMRYLTSVEIKKGKTLPIFVELRKINEKSSLESLIIKNLEELGFDLESVELNPLFSSGKCSLILDAFDEIPEKFVQPTINYLESIFNKHHNLRVITSSRPGAEIQKTPFVEVFRIKPLMQSDYKRLLARLFHDDDSKINEIIKAISNSEVQIKELITTPLLLTLLVIIYKSYNKIPKNLSEFYSHLFNILCYRHDSTKPGFKREFSTDLTESELKLLFESFCFCCMKNQSISLDSTKTSSLISEAKGLAKMDSVKPEAFIRDITKVTCLMIQEGLEYHFIHKSIREFHAANFIKEQGTQELKENFYNYAVKNSKKFPQELSFLSSIDTYNYNKLFLVPHINMIFESAGYDKENKILNVNPRKLFEHIFINVMQRGRKLQEDGYEDEILLTFSVKSSDYIIQSIYPINDLLIQKLFHYISEIDSSREFYVKLLSKFKDAQESSGLRAAGDEHGELRAIDFIAYIDSEKDFTEEMLGILSELNSNLTQACEFVDKTESSFNAISF